jgi:hypothetical protein
MDSTLVASNIRRMGRVQLLVEVLQRVQRMLNKSDQERYAADFAPYVVPVWIKWGNLSTSVRNN